MPTGRPEDISPDTLIHRVGGGEVANLRLSTLDSQESPPGISVLLAGSAQSAAEQMRVQFPRSRKWQTACKTVGTATAEAIRKAGFDVVPDATERFPNHGRLIHPDGAAGFNNEIALKRLAKAFQTVKEPW